MRFSKSRKIWWSRVEGWKKEYGIDKTVVFHRDLTTVGSFFGCQKCGRRDRVLERHHKGREYLFACIMPEKYAKNYAMFRPQDIVILCHQCHQRADKVLQPIVREMMQARKLADLNFQDLEVYRIAMVKRTEQWMMRGNKCQQTQSA